MIDFTYPLVGPITAFRDYLELRRLRRELPSVHRRLVSTPNGMVAETDADYLDRLRDISDERFG